MCQLNFEIQYIHSKKYSYKVLRNSFAYITSPMLYRLVLGRLTNETAQNVCKFANRLTETNIF